ncbi:MAG: hypothetical protein HYZ38_18830 [Mycobacterium sp.]|nr:hypothetical protein [Mycobacterium sp.]
MSTTQNPDSVARVAQVGPKSEYDTSWQTTLLTVLAVVMAVIAAALILMNTSTPLP